MRSIIPQRLQTALISLTAITGVLLAAEAGAEWYAAKQFNAAEVDISLLQDTATVEQLDSNGCKMDIRLEPVPYQGLRQGVGTITIKGTGKSTGTCKPLTAPFTLNSDYDYQATSNNSGSYFGTLVLNNFNLQMAGDSAVTGTVVLKNVPAKPSATWLASAITKADLLAIKPPTSLIPTAWRSKVPPDATNKNLTLRYQGQVPLGIIGLYYPPGLKITEN